MYQILHFDEESNKKKAEPNPRQSEKADPDSH